MRSWWQIGRLFSFVVPLADWGTPLMSESVHTLLKCGCGANTFAGELMRFGGNVDRIRHNQTFREGDEAFLAK